MPPPNGILFALGKVVELLVKSFIISDPFSLYPSSIINMRPPSVDTLGLLILASSIFPLLGQATFADVFIVKTGITEGGCDNINYDLNAMFNEASTIIDAAVDAFNDYNNDYTVRKLALSFFGIQMNDQLAAPKDQANTDALTKIQGKASPLNIGMS
jgi:hypothetical protein